MKKVVIFGGGTGLSQLAKGLKQFPVEITAVVSVADNGGSTGKLRKYMDMPAVGDLSKVLLAMSNMDDEIMELMNFRFSKASFLKSHSVKNLLLSALMELKGSLTDSLPIFCKLLDIEGNIMPLTEDNVDLIGIDKNGKEIFGEEKITKCSSKIVDLKYNKSVTVNPLVFKAIDDADLVIFSSGSILTSIMPHLVVKELSEYIRKSNVAKLYVCNLFTQPGETDGFTVCDHINLLERYLGVNELDAVIVNNKSVDDNLAKKYLQKEQKEFVVVDDLHKKDLDVILDDLLVVDGLYYRHDSLKTAYLIYSYMMDLEKK